MTSCSNRSVVTVSNKWTDPLFLQAKDQKRAACMTVSSASAARKKALDSWPFGILKALNREMGLVLKP